METYSVDQARAMSEELIERAIAGEEIAITEGSVVKARIKPGERDDTPESRPERKAYRTPGRWKGRFEVDDAAFAPLTDEELKDWGL